MNYWYNISNVSDSQVVLSVLVEENGEWVMYSADLKYPVQNHKRLTTQGVLRLFKTGGGGFILTNSVTPEKADKLIHDTRFNLGDTEISVDELWACSIIVDRDLLEPIINFFE